MRDDVLRDLDILREILDGQPARNGLIQQAIQEFIGKRLTQSEIAEAYAERVTPGVRRVV